jgi:subtilase family serine protease
MAHIPVWAVPCGSWKRVDAIQSRRSGMDKRGLKMQSEGIQKIMRYLAVLGVVFLAGQTVQAQQPLYLEIHRGEVGIDPIAFMRPHYFIHEAAGANLATPPLSAFVPSQIRHAYGFDLISNQGAGQTIGIVDAYDDVNAESDLGVFSKQFQLTACTSANGCFRKVYSTGRKPAANANWAVEIALDIEWAHAIAPQAKIVLVEAPSNNLSDLLSGVDAAVRNGASVVSMSWTSAELSSERNLDNHFVSSGVTFLAASGDTGYGVAYPAASPDVIAVGGTSLTLNAAGNYQSEAAWSGSGGGLSKYEVEPLSQGQFPIPDNSRGARGVPDVSYNANPGTGYAVYDSIGMNGYSGWFQVGGTSAGTPQWAALIAIANSQRAAARKANLGNTSSAVYSMGKTAFSPNFHAITAGTNGSCGVICDALVGYDYVTGLGTPMSNSLVGTLVARP